MENSALNNQPTTSINFKLDEVVELKGHYFKIVLIDGFTGKLALKWISTQEAKQLQRAQTLT